MGVSSFRAAAVTTVLLAVFVSPSAGKTGEDLESLEQAHGPDSWQVHFELRRMARAYNEAGEFAEARPLYARMFDREIAIEEASTGQDLHSTPLWAIADEFAVVLSELGDYGALMEVRQRQHALEPASVEQPSGPDADPDRFVFFGGAAAIRRPDESWEFEADPDDPPIVARMSSPDEAAVVDVQVQRVPKQTLDDLKDPIEQAMAAQVEEFHKLSGTDVEVNGVAAYELSLAVTVDGEPFRAKILISKPGNVLYVVKCRSSVEDWAHIETQCDAVLASFEHVSEHNSRFVPTHQYELRSVEGWTVFVNRDLLADGVELGNEALKLLGAKLHDVGRVVPEAACEELRRVPIWLGVDDGHAPAAEYHPSREWLRENGYNPDKARSVEFGNASRFLSWSTEQPGMVLHELAHAYHDRVLGYDHEGIRAAYLAAVEAGQYETVLRFDGGEARAYALENEQEYFAEGAEAYFGTNDWYPFVRAELFRHDPQLFAMIEDFFGTSTHAPD